MADHGYIEGKHVDEFFQCIVKKLRVTVSQLFLSLCNIAEYSCGENMLG